MPTKDGGPTAAEFMVEQDRITALEDDLAAYVADIATGFADLNVMLDDIQMANAAITDQIVADLATGLSEGLCCIGEGMSLQATEATSRHTSEIDYRKQEIDFPPINTMVTAPDGTVTTNTRPGFKGPAPAAAYAAHLAAIDANAAANAAKLAEERRQYDEWKAQQDQHSAQQLLYWAQAILSLVATIRSIELYNDYLDLLNDITALLQQHITSLHALTEGTTHPLIEAHADDLLVGNEDRVIKMDEKIDWACTARDELWDCWNAHVKPMFESLPAEVSAAASTSVTTIEASNLALRECADALKAEYESVHKLTNAQIAPALANAIEPLLAKLEDQCAFLQQCAEDLVAKYNADYAGGESALAAGALDVAVQMNNKIPETEAWMTQHTRHLESIYGSTYEAAEAAFVAQMLATAQAMAAKMGEVEAWQHEHTLDLEDNYEAYRAGEAALAAEFLQCALDLSAKAKESEAWLDAHAQESRDHYTNTYQPLENQLAAAVHTVATSLTPNMAEVEAWFAERADTLWDCYDEDYKEKEKALTCAIMECATELAPKLVDVADWLDVQSDTMRDHWIATFQPKEAPLVCRLLELALEASEESKTNWEQLAEYRDKFIETWTTCYEQAECDAMPDIIRIGADAQRKQADYMEWLCDRSEDMFDKWEDDWYPCDKDNLLRHCDHWAANDPLSEIHENSDEMRELAKKTLEAYCEEGLPCEVKYVGEVCGMPVYEPDFCAMEDRAVNFVELQFARARDRLSRKPHGFCHGVKAQNMVELEAEAMKATAQARAAANRFERWWKTQEDTRRHNYHMEVMQSIVDRWPTRSLDGYSRSTEGQARILASMHDAIVRGYTLLQNSQAYGQSTLASIANALEGALQGIRLGHDWPELYLRASGQLEQTWDSTRREAIDVMAHGHRYMQGATDAQSARGRVIDSKLAKGLNAAQAGHELANMGLNAEQQRQGVINTAADMGLRSTQIGQYWWRASIEAQGVRDQLINALQDRGLNTMRVGHDWMQFATTSEAQRQQTIQAAASLGVQTIPIGQRYLAMATDSEGQRARVQQFAQDAGIRTIGQGHDLLRIAASKAQASFNGALQSLGQANNLLRSNHAYATLPLQGYMNASQTNQQTLGAAVDIMRTGMAKAQLAETANTHGMNGAYNGINAALGQLTSLQSVLSGGITGGGNALAAQARGIANDIGQQAGSGIANTFSNIEQALYQPSYTPYRPSTPYGSSPLTPPPIVYNPGIVNSYSGGNGFGPQ